ncbi:MAG TPA: ATP-binding protein [Vicinamibacteria bacterium]|nr:ATP-binding protein [Vicinamibacteria bacterium]
MVLASLIDRQDELRRLNQAFRDASRAHPQLVVVWGRRRSGKTFLLSHFLQDKKGVLFGATQQSQAVELGRFHEALRRDLGNEVADLGGGGFSSWEQALRFTAALARKTPLAIVLDEVPYLDESSPGFPSMVQHFWDHLPTGTKLMLVLTGSAVSTVEAFMGSGAPLRGRPTLRLRIEPVDLWAARDFLPRLAPDRLIEAYAACGGYPLHLLAWDQTATTDKNLLHLAGSPGGILLEDAASILREELPATGGYPRVLAAIGRGLTRYSEIASAAAQRIERPLTVLSEAGFVEKAVPLGAPKGARFDYAILDPYLRFWFSVLYADRGLIEGGQGRAVLLRAKPRFETHVGRVFEDLARAHARRLVREGEFPEDVVIGRWWASSGPPCEIDVLGLRGKRTYLVGEAKWQRKPLGTRELESLRRKIVRAPHPEDEPVYALWSRAGAVEEVRDVARVFDLKDLLFS